MMDIKGFFDYFAGSGFPITLTVMGMIVVFVFIVLMMFIPTLTRRIFPKFGYAKYANYLPFQTVYNDNSMSLTDGSLVRVYRVKGLQTSMQDDKTKEKFLDLRAQLFNQIRDPNVILRFYMVRDAADENTDYEFHQSTLQKTWNCTLHPLHFQNHLSGISPRHPYQTHKLHFPYYHILKSTKQIYANRHQNQQN